jgi:hypothetical protein
VYCDESRPEALYSENPIDKFMVLGGVWLPREDRNNIKEAIKALQNKHDVYGEIKWKNVSPSKLSFYMDLVDLFFEYPKLRFRSIVVNATEVESEIYHDSDNELGFYKFYYQLLVHWCEPMQYYWIYLDFKKNKQSDRLQTLEKVLNNATFSYIKDVQAIESKESLLIQLADILIGAVGYKYNGYYTSDAKLKLIEKIEDHLGHPIQKTYKSARKYNIFEIELS